MTKRRRRTPIRNPRRGTGRGSLPAVYDEGSVVFRFGPNRQNGIPRAEGYRGWYVVQLVNDEQFEYEYHAFNEQLCFGRRSGSGYAYKYLEQLRGGTSKMFAVHSAEGRSKFFIDVHLPDLDCGSIYSDGQSGTHSRDCPSRRGSLHVSQIKGSGNRAAGMAGEGQLRHHDELDMMVEFVKVFLGTDPRDCADLEYPLQQYLEWEAAELQRREIELARAEGRLPQRPVPTGWDRNVMQSVSSAIYTYELGAVPVEKTEMAPGVFKWIFHLPNQPKRIAIAKWNTRIEIEDFMGAIEISYSTEGQRGGSKLAFEHDRTAGTSIGMFFGTGVVPKYYANDADARRRLRYDAPQDWATELIRLVDSQVSVDARVFSNHRYGSIRFATQISDRFCEVAWQEFKNNWSFVRYDGSAYAAEIQLDSLSEAAGACALWMQLDVERMRDDWRFKLSMAVSAELVRRRDEEHKINWQVQANMLVIRDNHLFSSRDVYVRWEHLQLSNLTDRAFAYVVSYWGDNTNRAYFLSEAETVAAISKFFALNVMELPFSNKTAAIEQLIVDNVDPEIFDRSCRVYRDRITGVVNWYFRGRSGRLAGTEQPIVRFQVYPDGYTRITPLDNPVGDTGVSAIELFGPPVVVAQNEETAELIKSLADTLQARLETAPIRASQDIAAVFDIDFNVTGWPLRLAAKISELPGFGQVSFPHLDETSRYWLRATRLGSEHDLPSVTIKAPPTHNYPWQVWRSMGPVDLQGFPMRSETIVDTYHSDVALRSFVEEVRKLVSPRVGEPVVAPATAGNLTPDPSFLRFLEGRDALFDLNARNWKDQIKRFFTALYPVRDPGKPHVVFGGQRHEMWIAIQGLPPESWFVSITKQPNNWVIAGRLPNNEFRPPTPYASGESARHMFRNMVDDLVSEAASVLVRQEQPRRNPISVWDWINLGSIALTGANIYVTQQKRKDLRRVETKLDRMERARRRRKR